MEQTIGKTTQIYLVHPDSIKVVEGFNARKHFDNIDELARDIKQYGLYNPLLVRKNKDTDNGLPFILVDGHRRLMAIKKLFSRKNFKMKIYVNVLELTDEEAFDVMASANIARKDFLPSEKVSIVKRYIDAGLTQRTIAKKLGVSQSWVAHMTLLTRLPDNMLSALDDGTVSIHAALSLVRKTKTGAYTSVKRLSSSDKDNAKTKKNVVKRPGKKQVKSIIEEINKQAVEAVDRGERVPITLALDLVNSAMLYAAGSLPESEFMEKISSTMVF